MKLALASLLRPLLMMAQLFEAFARLWAYATLRYQLAGGLHPTSVVLGCPSVHGTRALRLGRGLYLYRDLHLETQGEGSIEIGDHVVISRGVHIVAFASLSIGAGSMIGEYASIRDANHRHGSGVPLRSSGHLARPVTIGRNVWVGRGAVVLPGVSIGDGAVIGANAVVTRNVAAGDVVGGVPARSLGRGEKS